MGLKNDLMAVTDKNGLVWGTNNLRVIDASLFPTICSANPTYFISGMTEKLVDHMIQLYGPNAKNHECIRNGLKNL